MYQVAKKHWKNGFWYQHGLTGKSDYWLYCFKLGKFGIMISKPSRVVSFINVYELI